MPTFDPRSLVHPVEWQMQVPGQPEPLAVIRRLKLQGVERFRAVTWAPTSTGRNLIGYYNNSDEAASAAWRHYVEANAARHQIASHTHGSAERGGPGAK